MKRVSTRLLVCLLTAVVLGAVPFLASCKKQEEQPTRTAKIKVPNIIEEGKLKVGVNQGFAPYAVTQDEQDVGMDVEVANYLAENLGLYSELVAVDPDEAASALAEGKVDVVLSSAMDNAELNVSGPYATGGVAYYSKDKAGINPANIAKQYPLGVQKNSVGYWKLVQAIGAENITPYKTDKELIADITNGKIAVGVLDSVVASYAKTGGSKIDLIDYVDGPVALGIAVSPEKTQLAEKISEIVKKPETTSVFESLNRKWLTGAQESEEK